MTQPLERPEHPKEIPIAAKMFPELDPRENPPPMPLPPDPERTEA